MDTSQKVEVLKQAVAMATAVLADRSGMASAINHAHRKSGGEKADTATAVVDHFFSHFCELVGAE